VILRMPVFGGILGTSIGGLLLFVDEPGTTFTATGIALATFCLAFITSVVAIAVMWGTFRADNRAIREWQQEHAKESERRDIILLEHTKLLTKLDSQMTERDKFYAVFLDRMKGL